MASMKIRIDDTGRWVTSGGSLSAAAVNVPLEAQPGWFLHDDNVLRPFPRPTLVFACQTAHDTLNGLQDLLDTPRIRRYASVDDRDLGHDIVATLHSTVYLIAHDTGRSAAQKIVLLTAMAQGPDGYDPAMPTSFFSHTHTISAADRVTFRALIATDTICPVAMAPPHGRLTWSAFVTTGILSAVSATARPGPDDLAGGDWIRSLG